MSVDSGGFQNFGIDFGPGNNEAGVDLEMPKGGYEDFTKVSERRHQGEYQTQRHFNKGINLSYDCASSVHYDHMIMDPYILGVAVGARFGDGNIVTLNATVTSNGRVY
jgi:hypothetical protein